MTVKIVTASGRGVAERWRKQYQQVDGHWMRTAYGDSEVVYNKLCDLGQNPDVDAIAEIIGNQGWAHLQCSRCDNYVKKAADIKGEYEDRDRFLCQACATEIHQAFA